MTDATAPAAAPDLDARALGAWVAEHVPGLQGTPRLARIRGGQSNPTYFVSFADAELVLRKQPPGPLLPSAHAIDREYRVMSALAKTSVPVPRMVGYCDDAAVLGTPFYLMERVPGRVFAAHALPGLAPAERSAMYASMAETLAVLHEVDPAAVGLADFGKPGNYFARQVVRWTRQWQQSRTRDNPWLDELIAWLPAHIPPGDDVAICHGDFRIGNLMFAPSAPRVVAVLDWELATLGHPLADVAFNAMAWRTLPQEYGGLLGLPLEALGIPSEDAYLARYYALSGRLEHAQPFHFAFALFRFAVIFEGIAARAAAGNAAADDATEAGKLGPAFARRAVEIVEGRAPDHAPLQA
ncbi:MAG TPA: phosphotransferase family protein [Casimicrobiaceae bacterium]|nr:phosphotransferase family protein [Casimicrobiaceae bacterium]